MLKRILLVLVVLTMISGIAVFGYEQPNYTLKENLLENGGFEDGVNKWSRQSCLFPQSDKVHTGNSAAIVRNRESITTQFYQTVDLKSGSVYLVSAWVLLEEEKDNEIALNTSNVDGNVTTISDDYAKIKANATEWQYIYRTIKAENTTTTRVSLAEYTSTDVNFYVDDISICEIDTSNLIANKIELFASGAGVVPQKGVNTVKIRSNVYNQFGAQEGVSQTMDSYSIVGGNPIGVNLSNDGILTIDSRASAGTVKVKGEIGELSQTIDVEIFPMISEGDSNLFANGSFEQPDDLLFSGNFKILSDEAYDGKYSAYLSGGKIVQDVYLKPNKTYIVMGMVKSDEGFTITTNNGTISSVNSRNSGEWKRIWATINTAGIEDNLLTNIGISSQGEYYVDNLFVGELTESINDCEFSVSYLINGTETKHLANGNAFPKVALKNGGEAKTLRLICGLYSKNNPSKLLDAVCVDQAQLGAFEEKTIEFTSSVNITDYKNKVLKFFAWESNLSPLDVHKETTASDEIVYYISPSGRDTLSFISNPSNHDFETIEGVNTQLVYRRTKELPYPKDGITIIFKEGTYSGHTVFSNNFCGTIDAPVTIKAADGANVTITGDTVIEGFTTADTKIAQKLIDTEAQKHLVQISLKDNEIPKYNEIHTPGSYNLNWSLTGKNALPLELVINGETMTVARYPNEDKGYMSVGEVVNKGTVFAGTPNDIENTLTDEQKNGGFVIRPNDDRYKKWANASQARMYGFFKHPWADQTVEIKSINTETNTLTAKHPSYYGVDDKGYFYAFDILEEIDTPGEYYIDRTTGMLYLYPPSGVDLDEARVSITTTTSPLLWFTGSASNIVFEGIKFKNTRGRFIYTEGTNSNIKFIDCTFENSGDKVAQLGDNSRNIVFDGCTFKHVNGGVLLKSGTLSTLERGNSVVKNCLFEDFSRITTTYNPAVTLGGVGNIVSHNTIKNAPHAAILIEGAVDNVIEYNDISDVLRESDDMSAIYTGRTWISRGNKIRYNYIHDIKSTITNRVGIFGVYLDDLYSGMEITGNVFADFGGYPVYINGGRDNIVKSNIFANTDGSLYMMSIGMYKDKDMTGFNNGLDTVEGYEGKDLWYKKYPELYNMKNNEPGKPINNVFSENLLINAKSNKLDVWSQKLLITDNNIVKTYAEAGFDGETEYLLSPNSTVFDLLKNFHQIPVDKMGAQ